MAFSWLLTEDLLVIFLISYKNTIKTVNLSKIMQFLTDNLNIFGILIGFITVYALY